MWREIAQLWPIGVSILSDACATSIGGHRQFSGGLAWPFGLKRQPLVPNQHNASCHVRGTQLRCALHAGAEALHEPPPGRELLEGTIQDALVVDDVGANLRDRSPHVKYRVHQLQGRWAGNSGYRSERA